LNDNTDNNSASPTLLAAKEYKNQQPKQLNSTTSAPINFLARQAVAVV
jgi:hypothetical protein